MAKIGFIISSFYSCGGEERVVSLIASELAKYHEITIYTYENRRHEGFEKNDYFVDERITVQEVLAPKDNLFRFVVKTAYYHTGLTSGNISGHLLKRAYYPQRHLDEWVERINDGKFELMIGVSGAYTMLLGYISDRVGARCISWEHSSFEGYFARKTGYYRNRMRLYQECASKLKCCVVLNNDIAAKYQKHMGIQTRVIPNPKSFSSAEKADMEKKCFVTCGRVEPEKGYDDLVEAFGRFREKNKEWKLYIIGGGSVVPTLNRIVEEQHLQDSVTITGYTHAVRENLLKGSVFLMTSRWEGFPMTVTEALEMGLPVIAYGIPAIEPLVTDGVEGRIVEPFSQDGLVDAMEELASDMPKRREMSANAIEKAKTLEPDRIVQCWLSLIEEILGEESVCS